jgi:glycosyltransferase involved in cell wall biosynthesis
MSPSLVSVILINRNYANLVGRAIESVLEQTYEFLELIIVDDASTDNSINIIESYLPDNRVKVVRTYGCGASTARNEGIKRAEGSYIAFLDSDDYFLPEKIALQIEVFLNSKVSAVYTGVFRHFDGVPNHESIGEFAANFDFKSFQEKPLGIGGFLMSTLMIKRETLKEVGGFDPELRHGEDYDFASRLFKYADAYNIKEPLCCIGIHNSSVSSSPSLAFILNCNRWMTKFLRANYQDLSAREILTYTLSGFWGLLKFSLKSRRMSYLLSTFSTLRNLKFISKKTP